MTFADHLGYAVRSTAPPAGLEPFVSKPIQEAVDRFRRVVDLDPSFTLAKMWLTYSFYTPFRKWLHRDG
jgi:hypothetical protein